MITAWALVDPFDPASETATTVRFSVFAEVQHTLSKCLLCADKLTLLVLRLTSVLRPKQQFGFYWHQQ